MAGISGLRSPVFVEWNAENIAHAGSDFRNAVFDRLQAIRAANRYQTIARAKENGVTQARDKLAAARFLSFGNIAKQ